MAKNYEKIDNWASNELQEINEPSKKLLWFAYGFNWRRNLNLVGQDKVRDLPTFRAASQTLASGVRIGFCGKKDDGFLGLRVALCASGAFAASKVQISRKSII